MVFKTLKKLTRVPCPCIIITGIIPFSDCGDFVASLVAGVVSFMVEGRVGSVKG